jgi:hypothetical protein
VLSLLGLAGGAAASVAGWLWPFMIALSLLLVGRAFYVLYVKKRGNRLSAAITWASAVFIVGYWTWQFLDPRSSVPCRFWEG